jgi:hypothetical protein
MLAAGIGSGITGFGADLFVIDDVIADDKQAQSPTWRKAGWRWYTQTAFDRLEPNATVVIVMTRWHADDLAGLLLQSSPACGRTSGCRRSPKTTTRSAGTRRAAVAGTLRRDRGRRAATDVDRARLRRPASATPGRDRGRPVQADEPAKYWRTAGPTSIEVAGARVELRDCWRFLTVDLAASTRTSADYTVAAVWAITMAGDLVLLDGRRERVDPSQHAALVQDLRHAWSADTVFVESRMFGTTLVYELGRAGVPVSELKAEVDKYTRAMPAAARSESGLLWLPDPDECRGSASGSTSSSGSRTPAMTTSSTWSPTPPGWSARSGSRPSRRSSPKNAAPPAVTRSSLT